MIVFFGDKSNSEVLASLEGIDDDLDGHEIPFVMSDSAELAGEFDIETFPALVAFQVSMANNRFVQDSAWSSSFVVAHHEHTFSRKEYHKFLKEKPQILKPYWSGSWT